MKHKLKPWPTTEQMQAMTVDARGYWNKKRKQHGLEPIYIRPTYNKPWVIPTEEEMLTYTVCKQAYWNKKRLLMGLPVVKSPRKLTPYESLSYSGKWNRDIATGKRIRKHNKRTLERKVKPVETITRVNVITSLVVPPLVFTWV